MAGLAMLFDTDAWSAPQSVTAVVDGVAFAIVPGHEDGLSPVITYEPGDKLVLPATTSAATITLTYSSAVIADCIALVGLNFKGNVAVEADGSAVTLDSGVNGVLPTTAWGFGHVNNKWLTFGVQSATVWTIRFTNVQVLALAGGGLPSPSLSRIVGGVHYVPPRSYRINPNIDERRAGERSHQGSYQDAGEYPLFRRIRLRFHRARRDQVKRFREMMSRRAVRDPLVLCLDTDPDYADEETAYVQVGNRLRIQPYLRQGNMDIEFDEVIN